MPFHGSERQSRVSGPGDERLVALIGEGDVEALREAYRRHAPVVAAMATRMVRAASERQGIVDEAFIALWQHADVFDRGRHDFDVWFLTLAHRRAVRRLRLAREDGAAAARLGDERSYALEGMPGAAGEVAGAAFFGAARTSELPDLVDRPTEEMRAALREAFVLLAGLPSHAPPALDGELDEAAVYDYALGTIDSREARVVEGYLRVRPALAASVRRVQAALAEMIVGLPAAPLAPGDDERLLELLAAQPARSRGRRRGGRGGGPLWVALGLAAALGVSAWLVLRGPLGPLRMLGQEQRSVRGPEALENASGETVGVLIRLADGSLFLAFREEPPPGAAYRLWAGAGDDLESLVSTDGRALLVPPSAPRTRLVVTRDGLETPDEAWVEVRR